MPESGDGVRLQSSALSSVGMVRENNEDSVHLWSGEEFVLAVVADGMGGAAAGEEASSLAIEAIQAGMPLHTLNGQQSLKSLSDDLVSAKLSSAIQQANRSIIKRALDEPGMHGMGTTVTLAFVRGNRVIVAHVGDSRAYRVQPTDTKITQITSDHSFVEAMLAAGHITQEQAEVHPMKNVLYRALGQAEDLDVDIYSSALEVGDRLVLCSDGLTRHVKPFEIAQMVLAEDTASAASKRLIDLANDRGGEDNVSVIVVKVEKETAAQAEQASDAENSKSTTEVQNADDDTIVLADRSDRQAFISTVEAQIVPEGGSEAANSTASHSGLSKDKMQAERISDHSETPDTPAPGGTASTNQAKSKAPDAAASKSTSPEKPSSNSSPPAEKPSEGDGEGHDIRSPEQ